VRCLGEELDDALAYAAVGTGYDDGFGGHVGCVEVVEVLWCADVGSYYSRLVSGDVMNYVVTAGLRL